MARRRMIEVTIAYDKQLNDLSEYAQLTYLKILPHTDDFGRFEGDPTIIKARTCPLSKRSPQYIFNAVLEMLHIGLLKAYTNEEKVVLQYDIESFARINAVLVKNNRGQSEYPEPGKWLDESEYKDFVVENCFAKAVAGKKFKVESLKQKEMNEDFEIFWKAYPRKAGHGAAEQSFLRINPSKELLNKMLHAITEQMKSDQWTKNGGQYIPHPTTWLNQKRWEDTPFISNQTLTYAEVLKLSGGTCEGYECFDPDKKLWRKA